MESRFKLLGHPVHPILVVFPVGLFSATVIFDLGYLITGNADLAIAAFWAAGLGILGGLGAALFGLYDWLGLPRGTRARRIGLWHGSLNVVVVLLFILSWLSRTGDATYQPNLLPFLFALVGVGIALLTAWLGGELVYRLRVAVDEGAHLDAPSSLSEGIIRMR